MLDSCFEILEVGEQKEYRKEEELATGDGGFSFVKPTALKEYFQMLAQDLLWALILMIFQISHMYYGLEGNLLRSAEFVKEIRCRSLSREKYKQLDNTVNDWIENLSRTYWILSEGRAVCERAQRTKAEAICSNLKLLCRLRASTFSPNLMIMHTLTYIALNHFVYCKNGLT